MDNINHHGAGVKWELVNRGMHTTMHGKTNPAQPCPLIGAGLNEQGVEN